MKKRLFLSIALPASVRELLFNYSYELLKQPELSDTLRLVSEDNLHITLYFIGSIAELLIPMVIEKTKTVCNTTKPFTLTYDKFTFVPQKGTPKLVWVQFRGNVEYQALVESLTKAFEDVVKSDEKEHKEHIPHATLARFKKPLKISDLDLEQIFVPDIEVNAFSLMASHLLPEGPKYELIRSFQLQE